MCINNNYELIKKFLCVVCWLSGSLELLKIESILGYWCGRKIEELWQEDDKTIRNKTKYLEAHYIGLFLFRDFSDCQLKWYDSNELKQQYTLT